ncbi:MAG: hypothetical protein WEA56_14670 [Balneolaceae bacterium]
MITLFRKPDDPASDELEKKLNDLVLAFKTETADPEIRSAPYIKEDGNIISEDQDIEKWLLELEKELIIQRSVSGDGCYINPDTGKIC